MIIYLRMHLNSLDLYNFRGFQGLVSCDFHPNLTVFAAANGAGKTSILDAISYLYGSFLTRLPEIKGSAPTDQDINISSLDNYPFCFIKAEATSGEKHLTWGRAKKYKKTATTILAQTLLELYGEKTLSTSQITNYADSIEEHSSSDKTTLPLLAYYGTERIVRDVPQRRRGFGKSFPRIKAYSDCMTPSTRFKHLFEYFHYLEEVERREREERRDWDYYKPQLNAIRAAISRCIPEYTNPHTELNPLRFMLQNTETKETFDLRMLSDGYKTSIAMVMDIAVRMVELNPQGGVEALNTHGLILIDEVELHLHPRWQQRILTDLRNTFPFLQIICTTHSPQVLSTVSNESIRTINLKGQIQTPNVKTYAAESNRILQDLMGVETRPDLLREDISRFSRLTDAGDWSSEEFQALEKKLRVILDEADSVLINATVRKQFQQL